MPVTVVAVLIALAVAFTMLGVLGLGHHEMQLGVVWSAPSDFACAASATACAAASSGSWISAPGLSRERRLSPS